MRGFIHVHTFPFSARPGTAAARWTDRFVPGDIATRGFGCFVKRPDITVSRFAINSSEWK